MGRRGTFKGGVSGSGGKSTVGAVSVPAKYQSLISSNESKYGLPTGLLAAVADAESNFNPNAHNKSGASGMFQFMPGTAKGYGIDPYNVTEAADAAGKMLSGLIAKYKGDVSKALAGYNWGGGNVDKAVKAHGSDWLQYAPTETKNYIKKILG
jgi:soluble lytic murein transglycosylase-like protein